MWPFRKKKAPFGSIQSGHYPPFQVWPIVRTKPGGKKYGRAISLFINNWQCHLTTIDVFSDGAVDCWGFVDLSLFREKVRSQWIVPAPKRDQPISVFNFGMTGTRLGEWLQTSATIVAEVESIVTALNPGRQGLVDMQGDDSEPYGKIRRAKMGLSDKSPWRQASGGGEVVGKSAPILRVTSDWFELTNIFVYADGTIQVGTNGELMRLQDVQGLYARNKITNLAPAGSRVVIPGLGSFETTMDFGDVSPGDRLLELDDMLNELQGKPSVVRLCVGAYADYENNPTEENKRSLREAYERVPQHLRCYCGDMDTKDGKIRRALRDAS
jgi:hypothetical protein